MDKAERERANRAYYLSRGLCPRCGGKNRVVEGRVLCAGCREKHDKWHRENRAQRKAEGLCIRCGKECAEGRKQCQECLDYRREKRIGAKACAKWRQRKVEEGRCVQCGVRFAAPGHVMCEKCLAKHREASNRSGKNGERAKARREAKMAAGLCIDCSKPNDRTGKSRCSACLAKRRDSTRKWLILKRMDKEAEEARRRSHEGNS